MASEPPMRRSPEFDLIGAVRDRFGGTSSSRQVLGIGDDAAVTVPGGAVATSVDALVDGVHFRREHFPPKDIGFKALASALSDLAAMGAEPGEAYVWLGRPGDLDREATLEIADGIAAAAEAAGVVVAGGDLTRSPVLSLSVTAVGHAADAGEFVGRDGAEPGHAVCVTGEIGAAGAGLMLMEHPALADGLDDRLARSLIDRQLRPPLRLDIGRALAGAGAVAMIDVSDGLGADAEHLAAASSVGVEIHMDRVPLADGLGDLAGEAGRDRFELALDGEDYELLCVLPRAQVEQAIAAVEAVGGTLAEIGGVVAANGVRLRLPGGRSLPVAGHDQLRR